MTRKILIFLISAFTLTFIISCKKYEYTDYTALEEAEEKMLKDYYKSALYASLIVHADSVYIPFAPTDSISLVFARYDLGSGDKITLGKSIGYRYTRYKIGYDKDSKIAYTDSITNYYDLESAVTTFNSSASTGMYIAMAILNNHGKGALVMSSSNWEKLTYTQESSYQPIVMKFEITYLQR